MEAKVNPTENKLNSSKAFIISRNTIAKAMIADEITEFNNKLKEFNKAKNKGIKNAAN